MANLNPASNLQMRVKRVYTRSRAIKHSNLEYEIQDTQTIQ